MPIDDDLKKIHQNQSLKTGDEDGSQGGQSGDIAFQAFVGIEKGRDDLLPPDQLKRLLTVHKNEHEIKVKKQKSLRDERAALKEGKISLEAYRQANAERSDYRVHPILSNKAQFSGRDRQVNDLPNENIAETNPENRNELQYKYNLRHRPENAPRFTPKPTPFNTK